MKLLEKPDISYPWTVNFSCLINKTINYSSKSSLLMLNTVLCTSSGYQFSTKKNNLCDKNRSGRTQHSSKTDSQYRPMK